jgi:hypothetical protein
VKYQHSNNIPFSLHTAQERKGSAPISAPTANSSNNNMPKYHIVKYQQARIMVSSLDGG